MEQHEHDTLAIAHNYAIYARAIDEKRYDLLSQVFRDDAALDYTVSGHHFTCTGGEAAASFGAFLEYCYWTNHVIAHPMIELDGDRAWATARVVATHIQHREDGSASRWLVRGSYHDHFVRDTAGWRIASRRCVCLDNEGDFLDTGVKRYPALAWAQPGDITMPGADAA